MRELPGVQGSDRWNRNRWGRITASNMGAVMATLSRKEGEAAKRATYRRKLIYERCSGLLANNYVTRAMEEGSEREDEARSLYEQATRNMVLPVGFVLHPEHDFTGASPDGLINSDGLLEIKSPQADTLLEWKEQQRMYDAKGLPSWSFIPEEYRYQMQWQMRCCDPVQGEDHPRREYCDFWAWYPGLKPIIQRYDRDDELIARLEAAVIKIHEEVEAAVAMEGLPATTWTDAPQEAAPEAEYDGTGGFKEFAASCDFITDEIAIP